MSAPFDVGLPDVLPLDIWLTFEVTPQQFGGPVMWPAVYGDE